MSNILSQTLCEGRVKLIPFTDEHVEPLRLACAEDSEIWKIYPINLSGDSFDTNFAIFRASQKSGQWTGFAVFDHDRLVGVTNYINADPKNGVVEIGGTFIAPSVRGSGCNGIMKKLMIEHAFANGYRRIEFRVDERNLRSQGAVLKLGAQREGLLRKNRVTWTGFVRNTCIFGLLEDEWRG